MTATNHYGKLLEHLIASIAESSNFQAWVSAEDEDEALAFIHKLETDADDVARPCAFVNYVGAENEITLSVGFVRREGTLMVIFEADAGTDDLDEFADDIDGVLADMQDLSGTAGYLNISGIRKFAPAQANRIEEQAGDNYYQMVVEVDYVG